MNSVFLGISVTLFPVVSKHLSPALVNVILIAPLWDWRTFSPCSIMLQMVQSDLAWCGQSYLCSETASGLRLPGSYLYTVWFSSMMTSCCEDKTVLGCCSVLWVLLNLCSFLLEWPCGWPCSGMQRWSKWAVWHRLLHCKRRNDVCSVVLLALQSLFFSGN